MTHNPLYLMTSDLKLVCLFVIIKIYVQVRKSNEDYLLNFFLVFKNKDRLDNGTNMCGLSDIVAFNVYRLIAKMMNLYIWH